MKYLAELGNSFARYFAQHSLEILSCLLIAVLLFVVLALFVAIADVIKDFRVATEEKQ